MRSHFVDVILHFLQLVLVVLALSCKLSLQRVLLSLVEEDLKFGQDLDELLVILNDLIIQLP